MAQLDPEILELCQELEELGGGIKTRIQPIQAEFVNFTELLDADFGELAARQSEIPELPELLSEQVASKAVRSQFSSTVIVYNQLQGKACANGASTP